MKRIIYRFKFDPEDSEFFAKRYAEAIYGNGIESLIENKFAHQLGLEVGHIISIPENLKERYEKLLASAGIEYEFLGLSKEYAAFHSEDPCEDEESYDVSYDEDIIVVAVVPALHAKETLDGHRSLEEELIKRDGKIKIFVRSKEKSCHHTPHIHADYAGDKNYCSMSIEKGYPVLACKKLKEYRITEIRAALDGCIKECRLAWNKSDSPDKLNIDEKGNLI